LEDAFVALAAGIDPEDPWSHPDAELLDKTSLGAWLRECQALPAVRRRHELASLSLSCDGPERTSLLGAMRKHAALGGAEIYDLDRWEGLRVAEGAAAVALRMAAELDDRLKAPHAGAGDQGRAGPRAGDARRRRAARGGGGGVRDSGRAAASRGDHRAE
jgi:hypothetical protein